jgi:hypothetical protein
MAPADHLNALSQAIFEAVKLVESGALSIVSGGPIG